MKETLVLEKADVEKLLDMREVMRAVEAALKKPFTMPPKVYLNVPAGDFRTMPCYQEPFASLKFVNVHPANPKKLGLPTVMATIILCDAASGFPLAVMEGTRITAFRTGAMSGIATKHLAKKNARKLALVGAGVQARTQLLAISQVRGIEECSVYDASIEASEKFAEEMQRKVTCGVRMASSVEDAVTEADIISTCTPSRKPIVLSDWVKEGCHINAIGADAPGKQELDPRILKRAKIVVDDAEQAVHGGEINVPIKRRTISARDIAATIAEVVKGKTVRKSDRDVTVFCSTGLAIQDLATAGMLYAKALKKKAGKKTKLV
jgi:alanine dehydrogenase